MTRLPYSLALLGLVSCNTPRDAPHSPPDSRSATSKPVAFLQRVPHYPGPDEKVVGGLVFALWQDGTFVRSVSLETLGHSYVTGSLSSAQAAELIRSTESAMALLDPKARIPTDGGGFRVWQRRGSNLASRDDPLAVSGTPSPAIRALLDLAFAVTVQNSMTPNEVPTIRDAWLAK